MFQDEISKSKKYRFQKQYEIQVRNKDTAPIIDKEHLEVFSKGKELRREGSLTKSDEAFDRRGTHVMERKIKNLAAKETL